MAFRLKDKVIVITGATKGIGKGTAILAAQEGAHIVISGRSQKEGEELAKQISQNYGVKALYIQTDLSQTADCKKLIDVTLEEFGCIDGLVNNAGFYPRNSLVETDEELFEQVFDINIKSAFFCSKYAVEQMMKQGGGSIVHMGSTHGYGGFSELAAYSCAKGAMHTLSKHIAKNYAPYKIRSNWITVGWVATDGEIARVEKDGQSKADLEQQGRDQVPSGRLQTEQDMAYGVIYLLSDESTQVTGTDLHITGGFNI